jgi:hypothetical protein
MTYEAAGAVVNVVMFNVEVVLPPAGGVTVTGTTPHVTVGVTGDTEQLNDTAELKLLNELMVTVEFVLFPAAVVPEAGFAVNPKSLTIKVNAVLRL